MKPTTFRSATHALVAVATALACLHATVATVAAGGPSSEPAASMLVARFRQSAVLLDNGRVLVFGGMNNARVPQTSSEIFNPATGLWVSTGELKSPRWWHGATPLGDGRVLVVGGKRIAGNAEIYDPATGRWTAAGKARQRRYLLTATLLADGRVLVAGGDGQGTYQIYDPQARSFTAPAPMPYNPRNHVAVRLADGRVLVAGGTNARTREPLRRAALYDPDTDQWSETGAPVELATQYAVTATATLLPETGEVLVTNSGVAELYDPSSGTWRVTGRPAAERKGACAVPLEDGTILLVGGRSSSLPDLRTNEVYDPATGEWREAGALQTGRADLTATRLGDGRVLVAGGLLSNSAATNSVEIYTP